MRSRNRQAHRRRPRPPRSRTWHALGFASTATRTGAFGSGWRPRTAGGASFMPAGDGTGRESCAPWSPPCARTPTITVIEGVEARRLVVEDGRVAGVLASCPTGPVFLATGRVVLATGGIGGLFRDTTNPLGSCRTGPGARGARGRRACRSGVHPVPSDRARRAGRPMPLISEAVRGEGAVLVDETGRRFLAGMPGAELAPRDVVARAVWQHLADGHRVFLDAREGRARHSRSAFRRSPRSAARPASIRRAISFPSGRRRTITWAASPWTGRAHVGSGLWACGEVASTGLHGANRLASNSLDRGRRLRALGRRERSRSPAGGRKSQQWRPYLPAPDPTPVRPSCRAASA